MEKAEQRIIIKYFYMQGLGCKLIHGNLEKTLYKNAYSLSEVKCWLTRFKTGDLIFQDQERPD
jgi:hypothetical protein